MAGTIGRRRRSLARYRGGKELSNAPRHPGERPYRARGRERSVPPFVERGAPHILHCGVFTHCLIRALRAFGL